MYASLVLLNRKYEILLDFSHLENFMPEDSFLFVVLVYRNAHGGRHWLRCWITDCRLEEFMVKKFPFDVPEEYAYKPLLKGRATVEMKVRLKERPSTGSSGNGNGNSTGTGTGNGNGKSTILKIVVDGYNAPLTAGNFVDLVARRFYDGMAIQKGKQCCSPL